MTLARATETYATEARHQWLLARRKARQDEMLQKEPGQTARLLDFNEIAQRLNLRHAVYRGVQNVPLAAIVGSAGRYNDFTTAFLPSDDGLKARWERIAEIYLDPTSGGVPPVELYKVGSAYFVKDGNHRVSVARQLGLADIEAYVWEHASPLPDLPPDLDIDTLLIESERREFLDQTGLDRLRPGFDIRLTAPGGYPAMLAEIEAFQAALCQIDEREVPWEEAVGAWYDMRYEITVQSLAQNGLLTLFPERTPADFYVWVRHHQEALQARYGRRVMLADAARDFRKKARPGLPTRAARTLVRWLDGLLLP
ncbi:MAG: hypothetical protein JXN59_12970 [Anaerolineae bacterium]|nr:hypothetical protein [Anaerolineae bacterium]